MAFVYRPRFDYIIVCGDLLTYWAVATLLSVVCKVYAKTMKPVPFRKPVPFKKPVPLFSGM